MKEVVVVSFLLLVSCRSKIPREFDINSLKEEGEERMGGELTVYRDDSNAFSIPSLNLEVRDLLFFNLGNSFFNQNWVVAPASTTARDGLGPYFNARACSSCHFKDGRGRPPKYYGEHNAGLLFQLSIDGEDPLTGAPLPHPVYGSQLQDQAIPGATVKGQMKIEYTEITEMYADGTSYSLRKPTYSIGDPGFGDPGNVYISPRIAPQIVGGGLLENIPEMDILANEDINDLDGDGISGKANRVWDAKGKKKSALGRFGWKANVPSLEQQSAGAFVGDIGITSAIFPKSYCAPSSLEDCSKFPNGGEPEVSDERFEGVVFYTRAISVPARRNWDRRDVLMGKKIFNDLMCAKCHLTKMRTGNSSFKVISNQLIRPYTDLLLHDMGEGLADDRSQFLAERTEWRTSPLWGIGLFKTVNRHTNYLHDGRARNLEEAILWHGGEAETSKDKFTKLSKNDRDNLIAFLNTL